MFAVHLQMSQINIIIKLLLLNTTLKPVVLRPKTMKLNQSIVALVVFKAVVVLEGESLPVIDSPVLT